MKKKSKLCLLLNFQIIIAKKIPLNPHCYYFQYPFQKSANLSLCLLTFSYHYGRIVSSTIKKKCHNDTELIPRLKYIQLNNKSMRKKEITWQMVSFENLMNTVQFSSP